MRISKFICVIYRVLCKVISRVFWSLIAGTVIITTSVVCHAPTENAESYLERGDYYNEIGEYKKATANYKRAIKLNPNYAEAYFRLGDYDQAIKLKPDYSEAYFMRAQERQRFAEKFGNDGEGWGTAASGKYHMSWYDAVNRAITDYDQAIKLNPDYIEAYLKRGKVYFTIKDYNKAIIDYNQVIKLNPNNSNAYFDRGRAYIGKKDYNKAIADYDQVIKLSPNNSMAYNNRGLCYYNKKDYDRAIADYEAALRINPNSNARSNIENARKARGN